VAGSAKAKTGQSELAGARAAEACIERAVEVVTQYFQIAAEPPGAADHDDFAVGLRRHGKSIVIALAKADVRRTYTVKGGI